MKSGKTHALTKTVEDMDAYDTIYLGYPNWWDKIPTLYTKGTGFIENIHV